MAATGNMHNLTTLIKRLEAATSRLEDIAGAVEPGSSEPNGTSSAAGAAVIPAAKSSPSPAPAIPEEPLPASITDFDKLIEEDVAAFVTASEKIGGLVEEQAKAIQKAFEAERTYLLVTTKAKKPETQPPELMADLHRHNSTVDEIREANRASPLFTHLSAVWEGSIALGWIVEKKPADFVNETLGSAQYYGNKILKEYKDKDKNHTEWTQSYYKILRSLTAYVKEHYPSGLSWNQSDGIDALEAYSQIQSGAATPRASTQPPSGGGPPPPPPLPPADFMNGNNQSSKSGGGDMSSVFSQINAGEGITSSLKHVDKSQMTHKNPSLRGTGTVPERSASTHSSSSRGKSPMPNKKPDTLKSKKPSKKELDGNKWIIENFENTGQEVIEVNPELNHSILISRCTKAVIKVHGKANAISIDNCSGLSILVDSLVSSLDVIKSPKFAVQIDGVVPTVLLDQVDGAQIYLSTESLGTEIFTSKSSAINVVIPPDGGDDGKGGEEGDSKELALPEQIRTVIVKGVAKSEVVEHAG